MNQARMTTAAKLFKSAPKKWHESLSYSIPLSKKTHKRQIHHTEETFMQQKNFHIVLKVKIHSV